MSELGKTQLDPNIKGKTEIIEEDIMETEQDQSQSLQQRKPKTPSYFNVIFSGFALLSDGYQSGIISFINLILSKIYGDVIFNDTVSSRLSYSLFVGCVVGQLGFGFFVDRIGRKAGLIATTILVILGAALSAASSPTSNPEGLLWMMVVARGLLGVGVGGEYPCSSVSAGESADEVAPGSRGKLYIMVTNFVIDLGYVVSAIVPVVLLAIFNDNYEVIWRLALALGIIPPLSVLYFRLKMGDSKSFKKNALKKRVPYLLILRRYWHRIFFISAIWFIYDFIAYPNGVFSSVIISTVAPGAPLIITSAWNILLYFFYLPGSLGGAFLVDRIGRKNTLCVGLFSLGICGFIVGGAYEPLTKNCFPLFVILYGVFLALAEMGPGNTIGLIAMESFPTAVRGTGYGIAAAIGKVGATVGTVAFAPMKEQLGVRGPFLVGSGIAIFTAVMAWFTIKDVISLEDEDEDFRAYLESKGYDTSSMGLKPSTNVVSYDSTSTSSTSKPNVNSM